LREEHGLWIFDARVLRRMFGPVRYEDGSWRKLHNDELHSLYSAPNIVRVIRTKDDEVDGPCSRHGGGERCLQGFGSLARREETSGKIKA